MVYKAMQLDIGLVYTHQNVIAVDCYEWFLEQYSASSTSAKDSKICRNIFSITFLSETRCWGILTGVFTLLCVCVHACVCMLACVYAYASVCRATGWKYTR